MCGLFIANRTLDSMTVQVPLHVRTLKLLPRHKKEAVWPPKYSDNLRIDITFWKEVSREAWWPHWPGFKSRYGWLDVLIPAPA